MKALLVGDLHLKERVILPLVEQAARDLDCKTIILLGDYLDSHGQKGNDLLYAEALKYLVTWKKRLRKEGFDIILLMGNHDAPYLTKTPTQYTITNQVLFEIISSQLYRLRLQVAYQLGDYLVSHAGFCRGYQLENWHLRPLAPMDDSRILQLLQSVGLQRGGTLPFGSPIWADYSELQSSPNPNYPKQIVGHTPQHMINTDTDLVGIDTFSPIGSGEILLFEDNQLIPLNIGWLQPEIQEQVELEFNQP